MRSHLSHRKIALNMTTKHFVNNSENIVLNSLRAVVTAYPHLSLLESDRVVYNAGHSRKKVSLVSGGGAGHEPAWSGYVGNGMLTAAVSGDIFSSPSARQVLSAINIVPSEEGTLLLIANHAVRITDPV
jgi:dihydroxyacetone kinase